MNVFQDVIDHPEAAGVWALVATVLAKTLYDVVKAPKARERDERQEATLAAISRAAERQVEILNDLRGYARDGKEHDIKIATAYGFDPAEREERTAETTRQKVEPDIRAAKHEIIGAIQKVRDDLGWLKRERPEE